MKRKLYAARSAALIINERSTSEVRNKSDPILFSNVCAIANNEFCNQSSITKKLLSKKFDFLRTKEGKNRRILRNGIDMELKEENSPTLNSVNLSNDRVVIGSDVNVDKSIVKILSKGPNFAFSNKFNEKVLLDYKSAFHCLTNQIRWHCSRNNADFQSNHTREDGFLRCPKFNEPRNPPIIPEVENVLRNTTEKFNKVISRCFTKKYHSNITNMEMKSLKGLQNKGIGVIPSDKGGNFCVTDLNEYRTTVSKFLDNPIVYRRLSYVDIAKVESSINNCWRNICLKRKIPHFITTHYATSCSVMPTFHGLVKTHKDGPDMKIRPVVNSINGPGYKLSWLLQKLLQPLTKAHKNSVANSDTVLQHLKDLSAETLQNFSYPVSFDVRDMFTTIPREDAIVLVKDRLKKVSFNYHGLTPEDITSLLSIILDNSYFKFDEKYYKQCIGLPMGSKLSGLLADIFMDEFETKLVDELPLCCYHRYVDDIFMLTPNKDEASRFLEIFNSQNVNIKFEIENPDPNGKLSLLDFWVKIENGTLQHGFYRKAARSSVMFSGDAALPTSMKRNTILNEWNRIKSKCLSIEQVIVERKNFTKRLCQNHHVKIPNLSLSSESGSIRKVLDNASDPVFYFNVPFISDAMDGMIKKTLKPLGLRIRLSHKTKRLKTVFQSSSNAAPTRSKKCELKNCLVKSNLCYRSNVVYKISCISCNVFYIGSTRRFFHIRVKEHLSNKSSAISKHSLTCRSKWKFEVIASSRTITDMRIKEAVLIQELSPLLNTKEDLHSLALV
jgi:hypothetical protein